MKSVKFTAIAARRDPLRRRHPGAGASHGRRRADVLQQGHRRQRRQLEGPHDAGRRGQGRRPGADAEGHRARSRCSRRPTPPSPPCPPAPSTPCSSRRTRPALTKVLTYHVVAGKMDSAALIKAVDAGGGKATLTEVSGGTLTVDQERHDDHAERRVGRHGPRHDPRCRPVERRDPRRRQGALAEVGRSRVDAGRARFGVPFRRQVVANAAGTAARSFSSSVSRVNGLTR